MKLSPVIHSRLKLLALITVFVLPMAVAWGMVEWRLGIPQQRTAHGELVPQVPILADWPLVIEQDERKEGDWLLAFDCSRDCAANADRWWRMHRALGRDAYRFARLRIGGEGQTLPGAMRAYWRSAPPDWQTPGRVWLFDPQGRPVLSYAMDVETEDVLEDIEHLLRLNPEPPWRQGAASDEG